MQHKLDFQNCISLIAYLVSSLIVAQSIKINIRMAANRFHFFVAIFLFILASQAIGCVAASILAINFFRYNQINSRHLFIITTLVLLSGCLSASANPFIFFLYHSEGTVWLWSFIQRFYYILALVFITAIYSSLIKTQNVFGQSQNRHAQKPALIFGLSNLILLFFLSVTIFFEASLRNYILISLGAISLMMTTHEVRAMNDFRFYPLIYVAIIAIVIFLADYYWHSSEKTFNHLSYFYFLQASTWLLFICIVPLSGRNMIKY